MGDLCCLAVTPLLLMGHYWYQHRRVAFGQVQIKPVARPDWSVQKGDPGSLFCTSWATKGVEMRENSLVPCARPQAPYHQSRRTRNKPSAECINHWHTVSAHNCICLSFLSEQLKIRHVLNHSHGLNVKFVKCQITRKQPLDFAFCKLS